MNADPCTQAHLPLHRVWFRRRGGDAVLDQPDAHYPRLPQLLWRRAEGILLKVETGRRRSGCDGLGCIGRLQHPPAIGAVQHPPHFRELVFGDILLSGHERHGGRRDLEQGPQKARPGGVVGGGGGASEDIIDANHLQQGL